MPTTLRRAHEAIRALLRTEAQAARSPQGDNRYDELRFEIDRAQEMTGEMTNWPRVLELGRALLGDGHEDLRIAAYTARAAQSIDGLDGFVFGLALFAELIGPRWMTVSPPHSRLRARANALRWWVHAACQLLQQAHPRSAIATDEITEIATAIDALRDQSRTHLGGHSPALGELKRELLQLGTRSAVTHEDTTTEQTTTDPCTPQPPGEPEPVPVPKADADADADLDNARNDPPPKVPRPAPAAGSSVTQGPVSPTSAPSNTDLARQLRHAGQELIDIASRLRRINIRDPRAYNVLRHGLWLHLEALPPVTDGKTQIPARDPSTTRHLKALEMRTAWSELIDLGERLLIRHRLDLDLQRIIATALTSLDPPAREAAAAVQTRTVELAQRFPGLLALRCREGVALADADTRVWLRQGTALQAQSVPPTGAQHGPVNSPALPDTNIHPQEQGQAAPFVARLELAEGALASGKNTFAAALFAGLETLVDLHHLDRWRPELAKRVLLGALRAQASTPVISTQAQRLGALCPKALAEFLEPSTSTHRSSSL